MNDQKVYVQYGAGDEAVKGWVSFDASPTLRIQKIPILGKLLRSKLNCVFDDDIHYGDIVKGLPLKPESVDGLFCSHVLEHLSHADCSIALKNSYGYLKKGGVFRIIVPDLSHYIENYRRAHSSADAGTASKAAYEFCRGTGLGREMSRSTVLRRLMDSFSGSGHRWMYDYQGLAAALAEHGYVNITRFVQGKCHDEMFLRPERDHQFGDIIHPYGLAIECRKPL